MIFHSLMVPPNVSLQFLNHPPFSLRTFPRKPSPPRAFREWREYEEAVKRKDLAGALRFLKSFQTQQQQQSVEPSSPSSIAESTRSRFIELEQFGPQRDWEVLDTCLNANDMKLVGSAYKFLKDRGFLPNFGKCRNIVLEGPRNVTPDVLTSSTGLEVTKLAPKKWGLSDSSSTVLVAFLGGMSFLISQGIDLRPNLAVILGLAFIDSIFLGGTCLAQISSYWPPYRRRILIHESGHLLTAYLMGCPIRGVILDPIVAMQMGIQGQMRSFNLQSNQAVAIESSMEGEGWLILAGFVTETTISTVVLVLAATIVITFSAAGAVLSNSIHGGKRWRVLKEPPYKGGGMADSTWRFMAAAWRLAGMEETGPMAEKAGTQFWDEKVANDLAEGRLDGTAFDRYCMVLFAGIAAEALVYGEAEGGENDENLFRSICLLLEPPLSVAEMSNQARWSVLQSYNLLKWHRAAHRAAVKALESGGSLSVVIRSIEETLYFKK